MKALWEFSPWRKNESECDARERAGKKRFRNAEFETKYGEHRECRECRRRDVDALQRRHEGARNAEVNFSDLVKDDVQPKPNRQIQNRANDCCRDQRERRMQRPIAAQ